MRRRFARSALVACGLWLAAYELQVAALPHWHIMLFGRAAHLVVLGLASGLCLLRAATHRKERAGWLLIGLGCTSWTLGETYFTVALWNLKQIPVPSWADVGYLAFPPLVFAGIVVLARRRVQNLPRSVWIDAVAASLAVAGLSAAIVFDAVLHTVGGSPVAVATNLAYPISDLILLALLVGVVAASGWRVTSTWLLLGLGVVVFCIADSLYLVQTANATYTAGGVFDAGWWGGIALLAAAAWTQTRERHDSGPVEGERTILIPLAFAALALGGLIYGALRSRPLSPLAVGLDSGSLAAIGLRLYLTFAQNQRMLDDTRHHALTDSLTGLANRRALTSDLAAAAGTGVAVVLALFDLDGFKSYNDTFGHPAGDDLLRRLSARLANTLNGRGTCYRLGGDEFCALIDPGQEIVQPILDAALSALTEHGDGFSVGCSYGALTLPVEAATPDAALTLADRRMYADKHRGRVSAERQSADVLVRALAERSPDLEGHLSDVATLATATAQRLGLDAGAIDIINRAAELHDIGKVAIPDAILRKPAPLDEEEWVFMRRHAAIGERILLAAPALAPVAKLVRASHERFDGTGYPERLAHDEIPLGARIIAICDAFDAMTSDRPYSVPRAAAEAENELRRCAGTQFDPVVVDAFCRARKGTAQSAPARA